MSSRAAGALEKLRAFGQPLINTFFDYKAVAKDCAAGIRKRPIRSVRNLAIFGGVVYVWYAKPDEQSYWNQMTSDSNELLLLSNSVRNPRSAQYINNLWTSRSREQLRYVNCGLFSLIIESPQPTLCKSYDYACSHLKPGPITFHKRIVDIGVVGRWLYIGREMQDYDVNDDESCVVSV